MRSGLVVATTDQLILAVIRALSDGDNGVEIEDVYSAIRSATEREVMIADDPAESDFREAEASLISLCLIRVDGDRFFVTSTGKLVGGHQLPEDYFLE